MGTPKSIMKAEEVKEIPHRPEVRSPMPSGTDRAGGDGSGVVVTPERIRLRAFEIYQARNGGLGDAESDWTQAERELSGRAGVCDAGDLEYRGMTEIRSGAEVRR